MARACAYVEGSLRLGPRRHAAEAAYANLCRLCAVPREPAAAEALRAAKNATEKANPASERIASGQTGTARPSWAAVISAPGRSAPTSCGRSGGAEAPVSA